MLVLDDRARDREQGGQGVTLPDRNEGQSDFGARFLRLMPMLRFWI